MINQSDKDGSTGSSRILEDGGSSRDPTDRCEFIEVKAGPKLSFRN